MSEDNKILQDCIKKLNATYGKGAVMDFSSPDTELQVIEKIGSNSLKLDMCLGGGYPKGRIVEIIGPEASGKTTLCLYAIKKIQEEGGRAAIVDAEQSLDLEYAKLLGVDVENLILSQPDSGEQALEITEALIKTGKIQICIVDSVAALTPQAEIDGNYGDSKVGLQARLMSQAMRKLTSIVKNYDCLLIFTNQLRMKIGIMFGNPETTTGGEALKFYASQRIDIRKSTLIREGDQEKGEVIGNKVKIKIIKNKVAPPYRSCELTNLYGIGFDKISEIIDICIDHEVIKQEGSMLFYQETKLGMNYDSVWALLNDNPELLDELEHQCKIKLRLVQLTLEQEQEIMELEWKKKWGSFETRLSEVAQKYNLDISRWVEVVAEPGFRDNCEKYKALTNYALSQEIKLWIKNNNVE